MCIGVEEKALVGLSLKCTDLYLSADNNKTPVIILFLFGKNHFCCSIRHGLENSQRDARRLIKRLFQGYEWEYRYLCTCPMSLTRP